jgi:O-phospho-L-seryl-tRNASec:L-selenocysteinyl-tRNA synthase
MEELFEKLLSNKSASTYISVVGGSSKTARDNLARQLLTNRRMPKDGWSDATIEWFLHEISCLDSNNFEQSVGLGEREGRVWSGLVKRRHWYFAHGIGRSGDLGEVQPKAPGSSVMQRLTHYLVTDALRLAGMSKQITQGVLVVPMCTGMSLCLSMQALKARRPRAKFVIWSRVDQKSCFKSVLTAGLEPIIIHGKVVGDEICTDLNAMQEAVEQHGADAICAIMTTTSCFAPRVPDLLVAVTKLCQRFGIPHLVNNAYGVQSVACVNLLNQAWGERDQTKDIDFVIVQSTDKNFMVPVGGAVICSPNASLIQAISATYPGRASISPIMDLFVTLLSMGQTEWIKLLNQRKECYQLLKSSLETFSQTADVRVLSTPKNDISLALKLPVFPRDQVTFLGARLFARFVSGTRVVNCQPSAQGTSQITSIQGYEFPGWMSHTKEYPPCSSSGYLNAAAALGLDPSDVSVFVNRLSTQIHQLTSKSPKERGLVDSIAQNNAGQISQDDGLRENK